MSAAPSQNYQILRDAIVRNSAAVMSLPSAGMVRHHKTRFLAEADKGFWLEAAPDRPLIDSLAAEKTPIGVAFKAGLSSVAFVAPIIAQNQVFRINDAVTVEALLVAFPLDFQRTQRRQAYRVALPPDHQVSMRLWHIPERAILRDRPLPSLELFGQLDDLSATGLGITLRPGRDGEPAKAILGERLRISITWTDKELLTEGRVVHKTVSGDNHTVMGVQFKKLEKDLEGRQVQARLTEVVGYLQREEIKRTKK